jgi:hypothetical protein
MKVFFILLALFSMPVLAQFDDLKKLDVKTIKEKGCPLVNGKKDCSADEVKTKLLDVKKKLKF